MEISNRIVADVPTDHPALGFEDYALALSEAISSADQPQFTVGLYGNWGSGKSSLLRAMNRILSANDNVITVTFDAWRYQRTQEVVIPLLHAVLAAVQRTNDQTLIASVGRLLRAFGLSVGFKVPVIGLEFSAQDVKNAWDAEAHPPVSLDDAFARPFEELRRVGQDLGDRRIVVFIDDLDRCTTENVVAMLESINVITDVAGFVFVLALDYDVVVGAVQRRYPHASGHDFIEKIIQVPFRIPRVSTTSPGALEALLPDFARHEHLVDVRDELRDAIELAFRGNPRSVKRFVNALTLSMRILSARQVEFDGRLLARILAMELRWPDEFRRVRMAVADDQANPLESLRNAEDDDLRLFASRTMHVSADELHQLLRYTSALVDAESTSAESPTPRTRSPRTRTSSAEEIANGRSVVVEALERAGFEQSPIAPAQYINRSARQYLVVFEDDLVSLSRLADERHPSWEEIQAYDLGTQSGEAANAIRKLVPPGGRAWVGLFEPDGSK